MGFKYIRTGCHRVVVLLGRYAFKVPNFYEWPMFLKGLLANMQEARLGRQDWLELCPVLFYIPGGWLVVMRRAAALTDEEYLAMDYEEFKNRHVTEGFCFPVEAKTNSFGWLDGRIVAVDYGS